MTDDEVTAVTLTEAAALLRERRDVVGVDFTGLDLRRARRGRASSGAA
ncbi:MAG: hypothetical protein Q8S73_31685 [Deltaproteobacteria bacterium]|nr:hypothetical protein [Myxococcales bacterium]MDP3218709.1 hypothetical protein [Deltaproteobacteria bacterium]